VIAACVLAGQARSVEDRRNFVGRLFASVATLLMLFAGASARAHDPVDLPELLEAFGMSLDSVEIRDQKVREGLHVLFGSGGNIAASIGSDGVLIVDDQFPELVPQITAKLRELGGAEDVDYVINTHWHFDHAEGNLAFGKTDARLVSHVNSRAMMRSDHVVNLVSVSYLQKAYPDHALPDITYDSRMQLYFNGEVVELMHTGPAHTTGDTAVLFRGRNAVHLGDVFNNAGYPFIDADNGGSVDGMIAFCEAVLAEINRQTVVIPGHGEVVGYDELRNYIGMLRTIRARVAGAIAAGAGFAEIVAAKPTADWDEERGDPGLLLDRVYHSLLRSP
jgi:cyclase